MVSQEDFQCPEEEGTFADPNACWMFYECFANIPTHGECPDDLLFNDIDNWCDFSDIVDCGTRPHRHSTISKKTKLHPSICASMQHDFLRIIQGLVLLFFCKLDKAGFQFRLLLVHARNLSVTVA